MGRAGRTLAIAAVLVGLTAAVAAAAPREPVLGSKKFAPYGKGFGSYKPRRIYLGGVASGDVKKVHWQGWGRSTAKGHGRGYQYKPNGGYYDHTVIVRLRARKLGRCKGSSRSAYTQLRAQFQKKPRSHKYTRWFNFGGARNICKSPY